MNISKMVGLARRADRTPQRGFPTFLIFAASAAFLFGCKKSETVDTNAQSETNRVNPFKSVEYYPVPNQTQAKTKLSGADAQPLEGGALAIKQLKLETLSTNNQLQVVASAPDCIYDSQNHFANSDGQLFLQNGDGKIRAQGEGFLWRQNESSLTLSNDVKTFIASVALAAATGLHAAPTNTSAGTNSILISAHQADFDLNSRRAIYSGNVHVTEPQMKLTCEWLVADLPPAGRVNHIVAETNVVIDLMHSNETAHATGEMAVYDYVVKNGATNETVTLTGNPYIEGMRAGMLFTNWGDKIVYDLVATNFHVVNPRGGIQNWKSAVETNSTQNTNQLPAQK